MFEEFETKEKKCYITNIEKKTIFLKHEFKPDQITKKKKKEWEKKKSHSIIIESPYKTITPYGKTTIINGKRT